ncbi:MAG: type B DNA-directed DNA polymerase [Halodesulfurarchaeum sp.]
MFTVDFLEDGRVRRWTAAADGATATVDADYRPTIYVGSEDREALASVHENLAAHPTVAKVAVAEKRPGWRHEAREVLAVEVDHVESVDALAPQIANMDRPGTLRLFDVDFTPQFRYCLETGRSPVPERDLETLSIDVPVTEMAGESGFREATIGDQRVTGDRLAVLETVLDRLQALDPDVLVVSSADVIPQLFDVAADHDREPISVGRKPGYRQLAGQSTYESYGRVGHSPARYAVPGRAIIDRSNTFFYSRTNLAGVLDLVERSRKPLQELGWASIGNVLTAIQIREARRRNVLVPWRSWRHERFKTMAQLQAADRGGTTLSPEVGLHEDVHELDFASMYPNIIVTRNISPETIRGDCRESTTVPGLDYEICAERGYLPDVLEPLIADREAIKAELRETDDPDRRAALAGRSEALKWILVSCFGYQGFSNAKFGRIEAHEAINAFARRLLLAAKDHLEAGGYRVLHGIVDSIWVTPRADAAQRPLEEIAATVSAQTDIDLEYEAAYDWVAFVPTKEGEEGALTKYFGRRTDPAPGEDPYRVRGIELRQRSTCAWVGDLQRALLETLDEHRAPEPVLRTLRRWLDELATGTVDPDRLRLTNRVSKSLEAYTRSTRNVAALERSRVQGIDVSPGQDVHYVVVDDEKSSRDRVRLAHEPGDTYDVGFYHDRAIRAAASILSPLGVREEDVRKALEPTATTRLSGWSASS